MNNKEINKKMDEKKEIYINHFDLNNPLEYVDMGKAETYEEFVEAMNQAMFYIMDKDMYVFKNTNYDGEFEPIIKKKLPDVFKQKINVEIDGKIKKISKKNIIEDSINKKTLKGLVFRPYSINENVKEKKNYYNLYTNNFNYDKNFKYDINKIQFILDHLKILCNNNDYHYNYILKWMAHIIKKPNIKTKVCIVMKSEQGAGKSSFWNWFGNKIIGKRWFLRINDAHHLLDNKFNYELQNKLFTLLDEAQTNGKYITGNERMKTRITEDYIRIEMKGHEAYTVDDKNNYILLTNNEFPVKVEFSDRRYFCIECSNKLIKNKDYFKKYFEILENEEIANHFYYYLLNIDLKEYNTEDIPETTLKTDIRIDSSPTPIKFAIDIIDNGLKHENKTLDSILEGNLDDNISFADTQKLYDCYKQFVMNKCPGEKMYVYEGFKRQFNNLLKIKSEKTKSAGDVTKINKQIIIDGLINYFNINNISEILKNNIIYDEGYTSN